MGYLQPIHQKDLLTSQLVHSIVRFQQTGHNQQTHLVNQINRVIWLPKKKRNSAQRPYEKILYPYFTA